MSACRSCGADILWAVVADSGRRIPLDPEPVEDGNVAVLTEGMGTPLVQIVKRTDTLLPFDGEPARRYVSHFSTCPHADQHRNPRRH